MDSSVGLKKYVDLVLSNWNWGLGGCQGCPYNDVDMNPDFAFVDSCAEVMVVAQNPGSPGKRGRKKGSGRVTHRNYFEKAVAEAKGITKSKKKPYDWIETLGSMVKGTRFESLSGIYWTNVCKCHPYDKENSQLPIATNHCNLYLAGELALVQPRLIVSFGEYSAKALIRSLELPFEYEGIEGLHGKLRRSRKYEKAVLFFRHWGRRKGEEYENRINREFKKAINRVA